MQSIEPNSVPQSNVPVPFRNGCVLTWPAQFDVAVVLDWDSVAEGRFRFRAYEAVRRDQAEVERRAAADMGLSRGEDDLRCVWTHGCRARKLRWEDQAWLLEEHDSCCVLTVLAFDARCGGATTSYTLFELLDLTACTPDDVLHSARRALSAQDVVLYGLRLREWWT